MQALAGLRRRRGSEIAITGAESNAWNTTRVFLLVQVVMGHLAAIAMPTLPDLQGYATPHDAFVLGYRLLTRFGPQAAFLFVFISGYFVGGPLLDESLNQKLSCWGDFLRKRVGRLAPTLILGAGLGAAVDCLAIYGFGVRDAYVKLGAYDFSATMTVGNLLGTLLCLQPAVTRAFGSNGPLWTLGDIAQFYVAGFWLCHGLARRNEQRLAAGAMLYVLCATLATEWALLFACWMLGAVARSYSLSPRVSRWGVAIGVIAFIVANRLPTPISIATCGLAGLFFAVWVHNWRFRFPRLIGDLAKRGAALSYSVYIVHYPVAFALFATLFAQRTATLCDALAFLTLALGAIAIAAIAVDTTARRVAIRLGF